MHELNTPFVVWVEDIGYCQGMALGRLDEAIEGIKGWLGAIWTERDGTHLPTFALDDEGRYCLLPCGQSWYEKVYEHSWVIRYGEIIRCMPQPEFSRRGFVCGPLALGRPTPDLMDWCAADRTNLSRPFHQGEWTYACSGQWFIRVPRTDVDYGGSERTPPKMERLLESGQVAFWQPLPALERLESMMQCRRCEGTGKGARVTCECCDHEHHCGTCDECEGAGKYMQPVPVATPSGLLAWANYERLLALPAVQIGVLHEWRGFDDSRIYFRFDGGEGLVMGMKWMESEMAKKALDNVLAMRAGFGLDRDAMKKGA